MEQGCSKFNCTQTLTSEYTTWSNSRPWNDQNMFLT